MTSDEARRIGLGPSRRQALRLDETAGIPAIDELDARLRDAGNLPDLLAASFEAFEVIRVIAHSCEAQVPEHSAAFMTCADAAVDGRQAITAAHP
jgi:hypothetical protein